MRPLSPPLWWRPLWLGLALSVLGAAVLAAQAPAGPPSPFPADNDTLIPSREQVMLALTRLPLAVALGTVLALRPRRRGTPVRTPAVVETQIMLAGIGALIMLIIGASLARAFGIVGAASLIRYRSKIDDPKDAVVMLAALAVGLASGVGLFVLAAVATGFLVIVLWVTESFAPRSFKHFDLSIKAQGQAEALEPKIEQVLRRYRLPFELRALSTDELSYEVQVPLDKPTDPISHAIVELAPKADLGVVWEEKKPVKK